MRRVLRTVNFHDGEIVVPYGLLIRRYPLQLPLLGGAPVREYVRAHEKIIACPREVIIGHTLFRDETGASCGLNYPVEMANHLEGIRPAIEHDRGLRNGKEE